MRASREMRIKEPKRAKYSRLPSHSSLSIQGSDIDDSGEEKRVDVPVEPSNKGDRHIWGEFQVNLQAKWVFGRQKPSARSL
jgi:hypothetical protein